METATKAILARRHDNGADFWASPEGKVYVGNPFSTVTALNLLHEIGVPATHEAVAGGLALIRAAVRDDGRIRVGPKTPLYPCYTAEAARTLCRFGNLQQEPLRRTVAYLLENTHPSGGWRCSFTRFGRGPETKWASPGATLYVLDTLRYYKAYRNGHRVIDLAVEALLNHWDTRKPIGPCHHGIGSRFLQVEYPFIRYNLFFYVYVLSFFDHARQDPRFMAALRTLQAKLDAHDQVVVEQPHRGLKGLAFCARGCPSARATVRYQEILANVT